MMECLVADIGGTHIRLARVANAVGELDGHRKYLCADYPNVEAAIEWYLWETGVSGLDHVALAVACAVTGDSIQFTNSPWRFSQTTLKQHLGLKSLLVLNDFEALALALPHLPREDICSIGGGRAIDHAPMAVIGPGTGLGVAAIVPNALGSWLPISSEGGHMTLAPATEFESKVLGAAWKERPHISAEAFLSGTGLPLLYRAIGCVRGESVQTEIVADQIGAFAMAGSDALCSLTIDTFCEMLGTIAGNVALVYGARGGVFIGGGIVPKILPLFTASGFRTRFESKGRFADYLAAIPTTVITGEMPALSGLAAALSETLKGSS
jgi:glucokinase